MEEINDLRREKLSNVKYESASMKSFYLFHTYKIGQINTSIYSWLLFDIFHLIRIDEVQSGRVYLKSNTYNFFWLKNDDRYWLLEIREPMPEIDTYICYVDEISDIFLFTDKHFEVSSENTIWF